MTQPAAPFAGAGVAIEPGGQLRLTSGDPLGGPPRTYMFGGTVALSSTGPAGAEGTGGLCYAPGGVANWAAVPVPLATTLVIIVVDNMISQLRLAYEFTYIVFGLVIIGGVLLDLWIEKQAQRSAAAAANK